MRSGRAADALFHTIDSDDPLTSFDVARYAGADAELARMIRLARAHDWVPSDLAFGGAFDPDRDGIMPDGWFAELRTPSAAVLPERVRHRLGNEIMRWLLSGILHGEQAALTIAAQMCAKFTNPTARAFAANQVEEEARHVEGFTRYIAARWGEPYPVGEAFGAFLRALIATECVPVKLVGINVLIEGFALGAFANVQGHTRDPALKALLRDVIRDEAMHHQFGLIWAHRGSRRLTAAERGRVARAVVQGFRALYLNLVSLRQRRIVFAPFGLDWRNLVSEVRMQRHEISVGRGIEENINPLAVLARILQRSGLLTEAAARPLQAWLKA